MKFRPNCPQLLGRNGAPTHGIRTPSIPKQIVGPEKSGNLADSPSEATGIALTAEELINRAKQKIEMGETSRSTSFRAAAEDIARACDQGATQREIAQGVGKSPAWVNRLLKWRDSGYVGAPFGDKVVQGVNKHASPLEPAKIEPARVCVSPATPDTNEPRKGDALLPIKAEFRRGPRNGRCPGDHTDQHGCSR